MPGGVGGDQPETAGPYPDWCSAPWPRRQLASRPAGAAFKQSRRSQSTRRASRAGHGPWPCRPRRAGRPDRSQGTNGPPDRLCPCSPPRRLRGASRPARARLCGSAVRVWPKTSPATTSRQAVPGRGDFCGDEEHSAGVGARSALRELTRRYGLNVAPGPQGLARSELSARPRREHRSAVGPKGRPLQHEPLAGAAWRDAPNAHESGCSSSSAVRREPPLDS
jgi:hypothetical protein